MKKLLLLVLIFAAVIAFFALGLHEILTPEGIRNIRPTVREWIDTYTWQIYIAFLVMYVLIAALSLPGALIMTLSAGAFFGLLWGTVLVSFGSSAGALLAFLSSRLLLRDFVTKRFGQRLGAVNKGVKEDGALYLFVLRLVPVFPFFLVNLLMGLTAIRAATFYIVSQIGMLPGTLVYVNAGTQLFELKSLSGILSPELLASFFLIGILPFLSKWFISVLKKRRVYAKWKRPKRYDRNMIVIGSGAAGLVTTYIAAAVKAKVTMIEAHKMGGDCLNYGCVPSKALIASAKTVYQIKHAGEYGVSSSEPSVLFKEVVHRVHNVIAKIAPHDSVERYTSLGAEVIQGYAKLVDPWTVEIKLNAGGTQRLTARSIVIAAGAAPFVPDLPGLKEVGYLTSDTLWDTLLTYEELPGRIVIMGGGPIGCELAQCFARLGADVTQIERNPRIMMREDEEVSKMAADALKADGVNILTEYTVIRCEKREDGKFIIAKDLQDKETAIPFDMLICAVGRKARMTGYGLEELGIRTENTIVSNEYLETRYPNIFVAGDVAGPYQFTHTAAHQGWYAAVNGLFGNFKKFRADYSVIPHCTFTDPEVARVGINENDAKQQGIAYEVTRYGIDDLDRAIADGKDHGFIKILTVPGKDRILGVTIVGEHAGDLLAEFVLAMKHGLGLNKILGTIHTYPTLSEANKYAAGEWKRAHVPHNLLRWVEKYHAFRRG